MLLGKRKGGQMDPTNSSIDGPEGDEWDLYRDEIAEGPEVAECPPDFGSDGFWQQENETDLPTDQLADLLASSLYRYEASL